MEILGGFRRLAYAATADQTMALSRARQARSGGTVVPRTGKHLGHGDAMRPAPIQGPGAMRRMRATDVPDLRV